MTEKVRALVGPSDIAELAEVSRGAVSNWRKRSDDFPKAIGGTDSNPLFALDDVLAWLRKRGQDVTAGVEDALWASLNALREEFSADGIAQLALTLACAMKVSQDQLVSAIDREDLVGALAESASAMSELALLPEDAMAHAQRAGAARLGPVVRALNEIPETDRAEVIDAILERVTRTQVKLGTNIGFVDSRVSETLTSLASNHRGAKVFFDPACGLASALIDIGVKHHDVKLYGQEISATLTLIARQRAFLRDLDLDVRAGDTLFQDRFPELRADVVLLDPPYGIRFDSNLALTDPRYVFGVPPKSSADFAWIQHAIAHLSDDGTAYVVTPMGPLFRAGAERAIREALLQDGCVRAIVGLPEKMNPQTSIPLALWALQRPNRHTDSVLLIDAHSHPSPEERVAAWLEPGANSIPVPHRFVNVMDLLKDDAVLTPRRWMETADSSPEDVLASFGGGTRAIRNALPRVSKLVQEIEDRADGPRARVVTIAELIEQGVVEISQGRAKAKNPDELGEEDYSIESVVVTAGMVRTGVLPETVSSGGIESKTAELTRPGDVLIVTWNHISAVVDNEGGRLFGQGVYRIRVAKPSIVSPGYLAGMIVGSWNSRFISGTTIQRVNPKELEIPLVSIEDQNLLESSFTIARKLSLEASSLVEHASNIETALRDAVRYGVDLSREGKTN